MAKNTTRVPGARYIYTDGTLIETFEERRDGVQIGETVEVTLGYCKLAIVKPGDAWDQKRAGRIIVDRYRTGDGFTVLAKGGTINARLPGLENGSKRTKERGIDVQYTQLKTAKGIELDWTEVTGLMCPQFTIQEETSETGHAAKFDAGELYLGQSWGISARIIKIRDLRPKSTPEFLLDSGTLAS